RRHTRSDRDWSSDVCSSDLGAGNRTLRGGAVVRDVELADAAERESDRPDQAARGRRTGGPGRRRPVTRDGADLPGRVVDHADARSEERRVGKEWRCGWWGER